MSTKFRVTGYEGLNKVAMTKAFREYSGKSLADSKRMTDSLLENGVLEFEIKDDKAAEKLLEELNLANANVSIMK